MYFLNFLRQVMVRGVVARERGRKPISKLAAPSQQLR